MKQMLHGHWISIAFGLYLILESVGSIIFLEGDPLFQMGRLIRIVIGIFLIYMGSEVFKK